MTPIGDVLQPDHVNLALAAREPAGAVEEVLAKLDGDERVKNLAILREAVLKEAAPAISENGCLADPVMLVFVAGIPRAFTSEYLRIVGAIVRMCRDRRQLRSLLLAKSGERFVALLGSGEVKL